MEYLSYSPYVFLGLAVLLQLFHHFKFLLPFAFAKDLEQKKFQEPVSVIICARNEEENLKANLESILQQDYPNFEVVVVNHDSLDGTQDFLESLQADYPHLKLTRAQDSVHFTAGKKYAQTIGIKAASHEHLVFTDADCQAASPQWLQEIANGFREGKEIVLGYSPYDKGFGYAGWLARYETFLTGMQYFSFAHAGLPYMGVGRNLAYLKSLFFKNRGFASHLHLPSGDDDLFVNEVANKENVSLNWKKEAFTFTQPKSSFWKWFLQKRRHLNTVQNYKLRHKWMLLGLSLGRYFFWLGLLLAIIFQTFSITALILIAIRILLVYVTYIKVAKKLDEMDLALCWPFLEIQFLVFDLIVYTSVRIRKPRDW